jgi:hypothetical protein
VLRLWHGFNLNRRLIIALGLRCHGGMLAIIIGLVIIGGFIRKLKANAHPVAGVKIAPAEGGVKERPEIIICTDSVQERVEILGDGKDFIERGNRIDAIEQGKPSPRIEAGIGGAAFFPGPDRRFTLDRNSH